MILARYTGIKLTPVRVSEKSRKPVTIFFALPGVQYTFSCGHIHNTDVKQDKGKVGQRQVAANSQAKLQT